MALLTTLSARNPGTLTGPGNNTYLLDGAEPTLIDAGVGHPEHLDELAHHLGGRALARVLVTHGHPDHASGVPALRARWPTVAVFKWTAVATSEWRSLVDGEQVGSGDGRLTVVHTPGHASDHVCFWEPESRGLFCGDMMTATTTIMVPPASRGGSLRDYLDSLRRLSAMAPSIAWPGHGPIITDPVSRIHEYLVHREERERQVVACLARGIRDLDGIVAAVYADTPRDLWPAARLTVEALLEKVGYDSDVRDG
jgi:glyoxylase-like metal-dependent hydrolase (beta-lactamase superfamily II)